MTVCDYIQEKDLTRRLKSVKYKDTVYETANARVTPQSSDQQLQTIEQIQLTSLV